MAKSSYSSPKGAKRGCLCKDGTYSSECCDGDFSGAWKSAKASVTDFGKNYDESIKRFQEGSKELTKTEKEESDKRKKQRDEVAKQLAAEREAERKRLVDIENQNLQIQGEMQMKAFEKEADDENQRIQERGQALFDSYDAQQKSIATYEANITAESLEEADKRKKIANIEAQAKNASLQLYAQGLSQIADAIGTHTDAGADARHRRRL